MSTIEAPDTERNYATVQAGHDGERLGDIDDAEILSLFKRHGAILFRGFPMDLREFDAMTMRFCSSFVTNRSRGRRDVSGDGRVQTVNLGGAPFPLHSELSREPWKPDIAWFACVKPPVSGGETVLCDGVKLAQGLSDETRQTLLANRLEHKTPMTLEECERWLPMSGAGPADLQRASASAPYEFSHERGQYYKLFYTPALHKPLFSEELAFANFLLFARYFLNMENFPTFEKEAPVPIEVCRELRQVGEQNTVAHRWQQDDLLMVDNTRFMHGRNAVEDVNHRVILTQFGYASFLPDGDERLRNEPWRQQASG